MYVTFGDHKIGGHVHDSGITIMGETGALYRASVSFFKGQLLKDL